MKLVSLTLWVALGGAAAAAACGSDDAVKVPLAGGAGGEAGQVAAAAGSSSPGEGGAAGSGEAAGDGGAAGGPSAGGVGGEPSAGGVGGEPSAGGAGGGNEGGSSGAAGAGGAAELPVLFLDFDDEDTLPSNLDPGTSLLTPSEGYAPLGPEGNQFGSTFLRGPTGTVITLTLSELPAHDFISLSMLFAAIDSLDGTGAFPAGDFFKITLDGVTIFRESFANALPEQIQSYDPPDGVILARHQDLGFSGPGGHYTDSAYDFGADPQLQDIPHTGVTATFAFTLEGEGVQQLTDESWAIDNLRVTVR